MSVRGSQDVALPPCRTLPAGRIDELQRAGPCLVARIGEHEEVDDVGRIFGSGRALRSAVRDVELGTAGRSD